MSDDREGVKVQDGAPEISPFVDCPEGYGLTEIVVAADTSPRVVREYQGVRGHDFRHVALIKGGATHESDRPVEMQMNEDRGIERWIVTDSETAVGVLSTTLGQMNNVSEVTDTD